MNKRFITVLDNGGETFDRYSIINRKTGDVYGSSDNPFRGFGQYSHNIADHYWNIAYGYSWRKYCDVNKCIKYSLSIYLKDCSNIGVKIPLKKLPKEVIKFIKQILED
jgi:hypothetical protein